MLYLFVKTQCQYRLWQIDSTKNDKTPISRINLIGVCLEAINTKINQHFVRPVTVALYIETPDYNQGSMMDTPLLEIITSMHTKYKKVTHTHTMIGLHPSILRQNDGIQTTSQ